MLPQALTHLPLYLKTAPSWPVQPLMEGAASLAASAAATGEMQDG